MPLIINKTTGKKFGKSEEGAVWLDPKKTSPNDFYQFWINMDDAGVGNYLKIFTELSKDKIGAVMAEFEKNKAERLAQKTLAYEITKLVHGKEAAEKAKRSAVSLKEQNIENIEAFDSAGVSIVDTLIASGLVASKTEARQLIASGGIYINDQKINREEFEDADFIDGQLRLRRGKTLSNTRAIRKN
jgi:tyrosyl-tRNA synthetase